MKKIFLITLLFLSSCGYNIVYVDTDLKNFKFSNIIFEGDKKITKMIVNSLSLEKNEFDDTLNELNLKTDFSVDAISKNSKGQVEAYRSNITIEVIISKNNRILKNKKINKNFSYNNMDNRFELVEYQNEVKTNLVNSSIEEIILFFNLK
jgi:hypothetical protein|tara:strand:- start:2132 stop:2581 length:450 start_codon:yes stop_codon:yes gene_type:complete